jgi:small subunit ribosomal protein S9
MVKKYAHKAGKRKRAVAKATVIAGKGTVRINSRLLETIEPELLRLRIQEPLKLAGPLASKVDIRVKCNGGGFNSQIEAARLAIAKALVEYSGSEELKEIYHNYDRHLLVADTRRKEMRKPMRHSRARALRQQSFR